MYIDLFEALNRIPLSNLPWLRWLWGYRWICDLYPEILYAVDRPPTSIRTRFRDVDRPIRRGESIGIIHFALSLLYDEESMDSCPIFGIAFGFIFRFFPSKRVGIGSELKVSQNEGPSINLFLIRYICARLGQSIERSRSRFVVCHNIADDTPRSGVYTPPKRLASRFHLGQVL